MNGEGRSGVMGTKVTGIESFLLYLWDLVKDNVLFSHITYSNLNERAEQAIEDTET